MRAFRGHITRARMDRLSGICTGQPQARDLLLEAVAQGCLEASIELAGAYRMLGQVTLAQHVLERVSIALCASDLTLLERERGALLLASGQLKAACECFERAWASSFETSARGLQSGVALALGFALCQQGRDSQALAWLERARLGATPYRVLQIEQASALARIHSGDYPLARASLEAVHANLDTLPALRASYHHAHGLLERAEGNLPAALHCLAESVRSAERAGEDETQTYALLEWAAVHTQLGKGDLARIHLARAGSLVGGGRLEALYKLRQGAYQVRFGGEGQAPRALALLEEARSTFEALELGRESAWAGLHLASVQLERGRPLEAQRTLERVVDARHALGGGRFLALELRALPQVLEFLETLLPPGYVHTLLEDARVGGVRPFKRLELLTLGQDTVILGGERVPSEFRRSLELACYFLLHPDVTLARALGDLFPDDDPKRARNYLHQVRGELARSLPGFQIRYVGEGYRVELMGLRLSWDYAELCADLDSADDPRLERAFDHYAGGFLPGSDSGWAGSLRDELAWRVLGVGLERVRTHFEAGRFEACLTLIRRLLEIDPFEESLSEYLVQATHALEGEVAARRTLSRVCQHLEGELGAVPPNLVRLQARLGGLN